MDKVVFFDEKSAEYAEFYVLEQTKINNVDYLLVTEDEEGDSQALILKDTSEPGDTDAVYYIVEETEELQAVAKVFAELLKDEAEIEM